MKRALCVREELMQRCDDSTKSIGSGYQTNISNDAEAQ